MTRDELIPILHHHRAELDALGVRSLALFGSMARNEAGPESDVDLLAEFADSPTFDHYMDVSFPIRTGCSTDGQSFGNMLYLDQRHP